MPKITKRNILLIIIVLLILVVIALLIGNFTFSYLGANVSSLVNSRSETTASGDTVIFSKGNDLNLVATTDNFNSNSSNLSDTTNPSVRLIASEKTKEANYSYYVGIKIKSNTYKYSKGTTADIILTVRDENGDIVTSSNDDKLYDSYIESKGQKGEILTCVNNEKIYMDGKEVYKYAVTDTVKNINKLLEKNEITMEDITYVIPHQSNRRILSSMANKLNLPSDKMYSNVEEYGNTFCASIPIALDDMFKQNKLKENDKVILIGYGGGLNTGSILLEL